MIAGAIVLAYVLLALFVARKANYQIRASEDTSYSPEPDRIDQVMVGMLSFCIGLLWPFAIPISIVMWHPRETPHALQQKIAQRDMRIAELERELGMRS